MDSTIKVSEILGFSLLGKINIYKPTIKNS